MARLTSDQSRTAWGTYLRQKRLQTRTEGKRWRGQWPMSAKDFCRWINQQAGVRIVSPHTYAFWEAGLRSPRPNTQKLIQHILESVPLPCAPRSDK